MLNMIENRTIKKRNIWFFYESFTIFYQVLDQFWGANRPMHLSNTTHHSETTEIPETTRKDLNEIWYVASGKAVGCSR